MKWKSESHGDYSRRMFKWHTVFALLPKFCYATRQTVWLEDVERRAESYFVYFQEFSWEYREVQ